MTLVLLTVFVTTGCSQIPQQKNMPEHERLSSQADYVSQLIGDAIPLLERYKKTKSPADAERYDEQVSKIETQWLKLLDYEQIADDRKIKESSEKIGNIYYDKQTVLNKEKITMRWVLRALRKYKDEPERGRNYRTAFYNNASTACIRNTERTDLSV